MNLETPRPTPPHKPAVDPFDAYEALPANYHRDARWNQVQALRARGEHVQANGLVMQIRASYGFEG